jgi:hypothetical protein
MGKDARARKKKKGDEGEYGMRDNEGTCVDFQELDYSEALRLCVV